VPPSWVSHRGEEEVFGGGESHPLLLMGVLELLSESVGMCGHLEQVWVSRVDPWGRKF